MLKPATGSAARKGMIRQRGVGSFACSGASSQGSGQWASSETVDGAKRDRLSSRFWKVEQASMHRMSA